MKISNKQYAIALFECLREADKTETKKVIEKFAAILVANNHVSQVEKILKFFNDIYNQEKQVVEAEIISTNPLDASIIKDLKSYIEKIANARSLEVKESVDKDLLGGMVIRYSDRTIDNSLRTRLLALKTDLKK